MSFPTSMNLSQAAIRDLRALASGLRLDKGRVVEMCLDNLEQEWRAGKLKVPAFSKAKRRIFPIVLTTEAVASLDRLAPGLQQPRSKVVELALQRTGKDWGEGKIKGITLMGKD